MATDERYQRGPDEQVELWASTPFFLMHLAPLGMIWFAPRWRDVALCLALYVVRMFFITAGYHRYFGHRAYKLGRFAQLVMALGGATAAQKGPLWWAGHHRHHHKHSDLPTDIHSPRRGLFWSHVGWILCSKYAQTPTAAIRDFAKYPELVWVDRYHLVPPLLLAVAVLAIGGPSALFMGFFLSTVLLYHGTFVINSLTHLWGRRRYRTTDTSRNSFLLAIITLGEGWHNNHHYYQSSARQGFFWWELDLSYYVLRALSWIRIVRDLREVPEHVRRSNLVVDGERDVGLELPGAAE